MPCSRAWRISNLYTGDPWDNGSLRTTGIIQGYCVINDLKVGNGALKKADADVLHEVSALAVRDGVPLIIISSNSGAAIEADPDLCSRVMGVTKDGSLQLTGGEDEETAVSRPGYGPETLCSAAVMASAIANAERTIPVICYVTVRSVGIGAYINKLGNRIIQRADSPMLLTGYRAINELLGGEVFSSNNELGGSGVMQSNGITDVVVTGDDAVAITDHLCRWWKVTSDAIYTRQTLQCITFDPCTGPHHKEDVDQRRWPASVMSAIDSGNYDAHVLIDSICDEGTFFETKQHYATGAICGRAYVRGVPFGIIAAQCQTTIWRTPPDPSAQALTNERKRGATARPARVLGSHESCKVAETIRACTIEGLPILILANWRGFDGGTTSMLQRVLATGSDIVRSLTEKGPPILVHVPMGGILSGGSMVVFANAINPERITFTCDPAATICVLEPDAASSILFKERKYTALRKCSLSEHKAIGVAMAKVQNDPSRLAGLGAVDHVVKTTDLRGNIHKLLS